MYELHVLGLEQTGTHIDSWAHGRDLASPEALAATYLEGRVDFLVGELDGVIVAMGALRAFDETRVEMKRVRVDKLGYEEIGRASLTRFDIVVLMEKVLS